MMDPGDVDDWTDAPPLLGDIRVDRIDNGDGTHTLLVCSVEVARIPANDTEIARAVWETCRRLELIKVEGTTT